MANHTAEHELKWHTSYWPLIMSVGILFFVPLAFVFYFVYENAFLTAISLGIGAPLTLISIAGWIREGFEDIHGYNQGLSVWAMPVFIVAEALLFAGFFASYWVLRLTAPVWPPLGTPHEMPFLVPIMMTIILVTSSVTIHMAETMLEKRKDMNWFVIWLFITIILGVVFLGLSVYEWIELYHEGFTLSTNVYSSSFFSITGFHASHVLVGIGIFLCILVPALGGRANLAFVKSASMYWHFVDIVWLFVVSQLYFWK